jgi:hypothetical protein
MDGSVKIARFKPFDRRGVATACIGLAMHFGLVVGRQASGRMDQPTGHCMIGDPVPDAPRSAWKTWNSLPDCPGGMLINI